MARDRTGYIPYYTTGDLCEDLADLREAVEKGRASLKWVVQELTDIISAILLGEMEEDND